MNNILNNKIDSKIFMLDACGALVSLILLAILYRFEVYFGMPKKSLSLFMGIAAVFFLYSSTTYILRPNRWKNYLLIIAILNISYCIITIFHMVLYFENLTTLGLVYFVGEVVVILLLSIVELRLASKK